MISEPQPESATTPAVEPAAPVPPPAAPPGGFRTRFRRILPWVSLSIGVISALIMDRGPRRAAFVAIGSVVVWAALIALHWMARLDPTRGGWLRRTLPR